EALDSPVEEASSSADVSAGTSIWRSRRSRTGPETRAAYLAKSVGVHLHPRSGCPSQPHPHSCVATPQPADGWPETACIPKRMSRKAADARPAKQAPPDGSRLTQ